MAGTGNPDIIRNIKLLLTLESDPKSQGAGRKVKQDLQGVVGAYDELIKKFKTPIGTNTIMKTMQGMFDPKQMRAFIKELNAVGPKIDAMRRRLEQPARMAAAKDSGFSIFNRTVAQVQATARAAQNAQATLNARQAAYNKRDLQHQLAMARLQKDARMQRAAQSGFNIFNQQANQISAQAQAYRNRPSFMQRMQSAGNGAWANISSQFAGSRVGQGLAGASLTGLAGTGAMKGLGFAFERATGVLTSSIDMMKGIFINLGTKITALVAAIGVMKGVVEGLQLANQEFINKFRTENLLKLPTNNSGMNQDRMDELIDQFVKATTFTRNDLREAISQALLLGVTTKELPGVLAQGANIGAARGQNLNDAVRNLVYMLKFGLQDEFRRATGFVSFVGEDPTQRNVRVNKYLNTRFGGQAGMLGQADLFGKFSQMLTELKRVLMTGPYMALKGPMEKLNGMVSTLLEFQNVKFPTGKTGADGKPEMMNFFEAAFVSVLEPIKLFFASFKGASIVDVLRDGLMDVFAKVFELQVALEVTKWQVAYREIKLMFGALGAKVFRPWRWFGDKDPGVAETMATGVDMKGLAITKLIEETMENVKNGSANPALRRAGANAVTGYDAMVSMWPAMQAQAEARKANYEAGTNVVTAPDAGLTGGQTDAQFANEIATYGKRGQKGTSKGASYSNVPSTPSEISDARSDAADNYINQLFNAKRGAAPYQRYRFTPGGRSTALEQ